MELEGSPSEEISEPPSANTGNLEKDQMIEDLRSENKLLRMQYEKLNDVVNQLKEGYDALEKKYGYLLEEINNLKQIQKGNPADDSPSGNITRWNAEQCTTSIFRVLHTIASPDLTCLSIKKDIEKVPTSGGFYMICSRAFPNGSEVDYPIYIGAARNFRTVLKDLFRKQPKDETPLSLKIIFSLSEDFPKNGSDIEGLESSLYVYLLNLTYAASKFLKVCLLEEFDFCLNKKLNNDIRMDMKTTDPKSEKEVADKIANNRIWEKGLKECKCLVQKLEEYTNMVPEGQE